MQAASENLDGLLQLFFSVCLAGNGGAMQVVVHPVRCSGGVDSWTGPRQLQRYGFTCPIRLYISVCVCDAAGQTLIKTTSSLALFSLQSMF